jgi:polysaccharide biosynthesis transport protein
MSETLPTPFGTPSSPALTGADLTSVGAEWRDPQWRDPRGDGGADFGEPKSAPPFRRYITAVLRYKWLVLAGVLAGTAGGVAVARLVPLSYATEAKVWVATPERGTARGPIQASELMDASGWVELIYSYRVMGHVVNEQKLYLRTRPQQSRFALQEFAVRDRFVPGDYRLTVHESGRRYTLATAAGVIEEGTLGGIIGETVGFDWVPAPGRLRAGEVVEFQVLMPNDVVRDIVGSLSIRPDQNGNFITLELTGADPVHITNVLNGIVERFIEVAAVLKRAGMDERAAILEEQRGAAQEKLQSADLALEGFRVRTITLPADRVSPLPGGTEMTFDPVFQNFYQMRLDQSRLQRDRETIRRVLVAAQDSAGAISALEMVEPVRNSSELMQALEALTARRAELRALGATYTEEHARVRRVADEIETLTRETIPRLAQQLINEMDAQRVELGRMISTVSSEMQAIPPRMIEETQLQREQATSATLFNELSQRYEEARIAAASSVPDVRLLDAALVPHRPSNDNSSRIMFMATMAALGMSLLGAILLDRMDPRVRYPEHITDELGLPILGAVPFVAARKGVVDSDSSLQATEAFRSIRVGLMYAHGPQKPMMVTITSPDIGDGKSFISCNLALAFGDMRKRTLLIDADVRRGIQHRTLQVDRRPGLTDVLSGATSVHDAIRRTRFPGVDLLPSGTRMQHGPELLGADAMRRLLDEVAMAYDVILVDSPPLGAGVDAFVLGTMTQFLALVVRTGNTNRELAGSKLDAMDRLPIRVLGAVLNGIPRDHREYRYYSYIPGYASQDEIGQGKPVAALQGVGSRSG